MADTKWYVLKKKGEEPEFRRWVFERVLNVLAIGASFWVLYLSFGYQSELLTKSLQAQKHNLDTSLSEQRVSLNLSLERQARSLDISLDEQRKLLDKSLRGQIENQRTLDRERLVNILKQISNEIAINLQFIVDASTGADSMMLSVKADRQGLVYRTQSKFKTAIWETSITKDYFLAHKSISIYGLGAVYKGFNDYNSAVNEFDGYIKLLLQGYADTNYNYAAAQTYLNLAELILTPEFGHEVSD